ncbi:MAG TPA: translation initiation factor eIF-1A [Candidatus Nanoarchaeia archaeon]|nr:translation initiation factor eIF-1A [Candidatus Nanoarchaeia archaeon]
MPESHQQEQEEFIRVRTPRNKEVIGIIEQRLGGFRMKVRCLDGRNRVCRIPGRLRRRLWMRENDIILVEPWEYAQDAKGDVIFKYTPTQIAWLKKKGFLKGIESAEEF